jgi:hypothetical protein
MKEITVPVATDIVISGDLRTAAESMTDVELRALVVQQYRLICQMVGQLDRTATVLNSFEQMMTAMSGVMGGGMGPLSKLLQP